MPGTPNRPRWECPAGPTLQEPQGWDCTRAVSVREGSSRWACRRPAAPGAVAGKGPWVSQSPVLEVPAHPFFHGGPRAGSQKELELGQIPPWRQTRICGLSLGAQKRPQHSACHPGAVIPHRASGVGAHPPPQVHKPQPRVTALGQEDSGFLLAPCPGRHCGVPEPPSPRLHQAGLRGLLLQPPRHGAGS